MSKTKKTKHSFSKEEKELIQKMKDELRMMGVPRDQWSLYIQKELRKRQKSKDFRNSKFMSKIKNGFDKTVEKVSSKTLGKYKDQMTEFDDFFEEGSQDEMDFMKMMFSDIKFENIDDLGKHGTTLKEVPQKKKIVVDLDFDENDD
ncbi:MAG: hypothetical protein R3255_08000 [Candidatus Lokiarchaeia archaeon]|nr:hypothetical protein [Candidatus Lokiarchaeia archaeon]